MKRKDDSASVRTVRKNGTIEWRDKDGKRHRKDGPAFEWPEKGGRAWYIHGKLHREDGPAMDGPLGKSWYLKGRKHREDGPAVEWADGRKEWYRHGKELTGVEFAALREKELASIGDAFKTRASTTKSQCPGSSDIKHRNDRLAKPHAGQIVPILYRDPAFEALKPLKSAAAERRGEARLAVTDALTLAADLLNEASFSREPQEFAERYGWQPRRLNPALSYLINRKLIESLTHLSMGPWVAVHLERPTLHGVSSRAGSKQPRRDYHDYRGCF